MREAPLKMPFAAQAVAVVDFANKHAHQHKDIPRLETANKSLIALLRLPKFANLNCRPNAPSVLRKRVPLGSWHSDIGAYEVLQRYDVDVFIEHAMVSLPELASQVIWGCLSNETGAPRISITPERHVKADVVPPICLVERLTTLLTETGVSPNEVYLALLVVSRLNLQAVRNDIAFELFTMALVLANKLLDDGPYSILQWAHASGLPRLDIANWEIKMLRDLDYCLHVTYDEWSKWKTLLGEFSVFVKPANMRRWYQLQCH